MDEKTLKQYRHLILEIRDIDKRIMAHNAAVTQRDMVKGGYGGTQRINIEGQKNRKATMEKSQLQLNILRKKRKRIELEQQTAAVEEFVEGIEDSRMRQIMRLRYMDGLSWNETAKRIGEFGQADGVRMSCSRYLRKNIDHKT